MPVDDDMILCMELLIAFDASETMFLGRKSNSRYLNQPN